MEAITRIVSESLARHGFDRPLDYRRLRWSRWFRCESHHSLLVVPSRPGVFALAEEIMDFAPAKASAASGCAAEQSSAGLVWDRVRDPVMPSAAGLHFVDSPDTAVPRRMLAVTQFFADDDMAFVLDRMLSVQNPMRARLLSGRYFVRFVVIEDEAQRRSICNALNQWAAGVGEKASGIGAHFAASLEPTDARVARTCPEPNGPSQATGSVDATPIHGGEEGSIKSPALSATAPQLDSGVVANNPCPAPFPSGF